MSGPLCVSIFDLTDDELYPLAELCQQGKTGSRHPLLTILKRKSAFSLFGSATDGY